MKRILFVTNDKDVSIETITSDKINLYFRGKRYDAILVDSDVTLNGERYPIAQSCITNPEIKTL